MAQYRLSFGNIGWRGRLGIVVATAVGIAAAIALVLLSLGLAIILLRDYRERQEAPGESPATRTIETDYTVIDDKRR
jgi:cytochrome c-type biogenesis protein CcmE